MKPTQNRSCTAFLNQKRIASGNVFDVALRVKRELLKGRNETVLIFDDETSAQVELDLRGSPEAVLKRLEETTAVVEKAPGPGRPKLGVVSREISLLPRHWDWLALQPGGASVTLRKLVEEAKKKNEPQDKVRQAQESTYKFMTVMAGNLPHYEEALRALYAKDRPLFGSLIASWPKDIREYIQRLSRAAFRRS
ncbi:MAG: hypothetical protein A2603_14730 [Bdellovibrionales bacterium RIFOXYD1_FULL_55_31]|nr:MAG: hypothetical protein A2603_14730 [Bdellovibrionales bacterium RIFOXYD1_FULL_55_31]